MDRLTFLATLIALGAIGHFPVPVRMAEAAAPPEVVRPVTSGPDHSAVRPLSEVTAVKPASRAIPHGGVPLHFERNQGQTHEQVQFLARGAGYTLFLTANEAVLALRKPEASPSVPGRESAGTRSSGGRAVRARLPGNRIAVLRMKLVGANPTPEMIGQEQLPSLSHYFRASQPMEAVTDVRHYAKVRYVGVYSGVDLVYYGSQRQIEYDFIVAPGADPRVIRLAFDGVDRLEVDAGGDLVLHTGVGAVRKSRPLVYQEGDGGRQTVPGRYVLEGEQVSFEIGSYDRTRPLVIDPLLVYSSYLGGIGADGVGGVGASVAVDAQGNMYVTGTTTSIDFPTTVGADEPAALGGTDVFVTKLSATGSFVYSTFLGTSCDDHAGGIAVDGAGNAYVTGRSGCPAGVLVSKLSPTGARRYFFVFGTSLADNSSGQAIAVDNGGYAYVTGQTDPASRDFPTTPGAYRPADCGVPLDASGPDGFVAKVNATGTGLVYSTFLCGTSYDSPRAIAVDTAGHAYVAGSTASRDFPVRNAYQPNHRGIGGGADTNAFITKLSPDGSTLVYSTYLGGRFDTVALGVAVDAAGSAYVTGWTVADDFPTTPGVLQPDPGPRIECETHFCKDAFVTKLSPTGAALAYSTYLRGEIDDEGLGIAVDTAGSAYVVGETYSVNFPILKAFQPNKEEGAADGFVAKLNASGSALVYSSYLGGSEINGYDFEGWDKALGIALDSSRNAYVAGLTYSFNFPTTPDAVRPTFSVGTCDYVYLCADAFITKVAASGPGVVPATWVRVSPTTVPVGGTVTATWAGLPAPSAEDILLMNPIGTFDAANVATWPTTGAANGTRLLALPGGGLAHGWYEIRLASPDPNASGLLVVRARSEPFRVGAPAELVAELVVLGIATTPAQPVPGQPVTVTVTAKNGGTAAAGPFVVDLYKHRTTPPSPGTVGDFRCAAAGLGTGAAVACQGTFTYATAGTASLWAQVDTGRTVAESNEANNVFGPRTIVVVARPDLVETAVGNPPPAVVVGSAFTVTDTVRNAGGSASVASNTRYYLSLDTLRSSADKRLTGSRSVPVLAPGSTSTGSVSVSVAGGTEAGTYYLLACADDTTVVVEDNETNNCRASATTVRVTGSDLVETAISNPPATAAVGTAFSVTDTVKNQGGAPAGVSTTRYYLSLDKSKNSGDRLLTGTRAVPGLPAGGSSSGPATVTIPPGTPGGTYFLLGCADDTVRVAEARETNNCRAAEATVTVTP